MARGTTLIPSLSLLLPGRRITMGVDGRPPHRSDDARGASTPSRRCGSPSTSRRGDDESPRWREPPAATSARCTTCSATSSTKGVFEEPAPGRFALNDAAASAARRRRSCASTGSAGASRTRGSTIPDYVRTGRPAYAERFGRPFWDDLAAHPDARGGVRRPDRPRRAPAARPALRARGRLGRHPHRRRRRRRHRLDAARAAARAARAARPRSSTSPARSARAEARSRRRGQSFFDPLPAGADLYLLRSVLNDWPDEETDAILAQRRGRDARAQPADRDRRRRRRRRAAAADDRDGAARRARPTRWPPSRPRARARRASRSSRPGPQAAGDFVVECARRDDGV